MSLNVTDLSLRYLVYMYVVLHHFSNTSSINKCIPEVHSPFPKLPIFAKHSQNEAGIPLLRKDLGRSAIFTDLVILLREQQQWPTARSLQIYNSGI